MTVLAIGLDVVDTEQFALQLRDTASAFVDATFTAQEQDAATGTQPMRVASLAARFAAKEAFIKSWSTARAGREPQLQSVDMREIELVSDTHGRPALRLHGAVATAFAELQDEHGTPISVHVSISHDGASAAAVVLLDA